MPVFGAMNGFAPDVTGMAGARPGATSPVIGTFAIGQASNNRAPPKTARRRGIKK